MNYSCHNNKYKEQIIYNDTVFILIVDSNWKDRKNLKKIHILAFVKNTRIISVRSLDKNHTELLNHIYNTTLNILLEKLNIPKNRYCLVYNKVELSNKVKKESKKKYILDKKNNNIKFKKFFFEKINNKNLKYYY